jgi:hypothetical protein
MCVKPTFISHATILKNIPAQEGLDAMCLVYGSAITAFIRHKFLVKDDCLDFHVETDMIAEDDVSQKVEIRFYNVYP